MRSTIFGTLLFLSIGLNVLTVSVASVANVVSGLFEAVTGVGSVVGMAGEQIKVRDAQVAKLDGANKTLTDANITLKEKNKKLQRKLEKKRFEERFVTYRGSKQLVQDAVSDTSERVSRRTAIGASRNLSATFGEALPVAGTAVIVAATALELNDACVIMQDLHELDVAFNPEKAFGPDATEVCGMRAPTADELWEAVKASPGAIWEGVQENIPSLPEIDTSRLGEWVPSFGLPWR